MDGVDSTAPADEGWQPPLFATSTWVLIISAGVLLFVYDHWRHQYLANLGFPGPKPRPIVGNLLSVLASKEPLVKTQEALFNQYGKVFGMYRGWRPTVSTADVELVRHICIKDFSSFANRDRSSIDNKPFDKALTALRDEHWKDVRSIISPTFSGSKMKLMAPLINSCLDPMIRKVQKHHEEGKTLQLKDIYNGFLIDAVGNCAFGLTINSQETENDPFLNATKDMLDVKINFTVLVLLFAPFLTPILNYFNMTTFDKKTIQFFEDVLDHAVELRKSGKEKRVDLLQLMLDAQERTDEDKEQATEEEKLEREHRKKMTKKTLTADELKAQGLMFFLAGLGTSNTTMGFASFLLATNPEVQDKLIAEIDTLAPGRDDVTYENIAKMTYLDGVICETLRIYPVTAFSSREAGRDFKYQGFTIPKGIEVVFSIWQIHHDPELWEEPEKFNPDRFTPEQREKRHPCAWLPFGLGPRNCVGMRFALLQVKMGLVRMLQNFRFETCDETEIPPVLGRLGFLTPANGFKLRAVRRS